MLEKTRIVHQIEGERNFHIFYQLLRGASSELKAELEIGDSVEEYAYLSSSQATIPNVSDADEFTLTCACMRSVGIDDSNQKDVFSLLSGVLHLGNVRFDDLGTDEVGGVAVGSEGAFASASRTLGVLPSELLTALTKQNMHVGGSTIVKLMTYAQVCVIYFEIKNIYFIVILY